jgi:hypothetical protein
LMWDPRIDLAVPIDIKQPLTCSRHLRSRPAAPPSSLAAYRVLQGVGHRNRRKKPRTGLEAVEAPTGAGNTQENEA